MEQISTDKSIAKIFARALFIVLVVGISLVLGYALSSSRVNSQIEKSEQAPVVAEAEPPETIVTHAKPIPAVDTAEEYVGKWASAFGTLILYSDGSGIVQDSSRKEKRLKWQKKPGHIAISFPNDKKLITASAVVHGDDNTRMTYKHNKGSSLLFRQ